MAAWECFADYVSGSADALFTVVSEAPLSDAARAALSATADARGYGAKCCAFVTLSGNMGASSDPSSPDGLEPLDTESLYTLLESLDPTALVATDKTAARLLAKTFRTELPLQERVQILGRSAVAFEDFASMLTDTAEKQRAWSVLKKLPRFS